MRAAAHSVRTARIAATALLLGAAACSKRATPEGLPPPLAPAARAPSAPLSLDAVRAPAGCATAIFPVSAVIPASGGTRQIAVKAPPGCAWQVESRGSFLTAGDGARGTGDGVITVTIAPSTDAGPRSAALFAGGRRLSVSQDGARALVHPRLWMDPDVASRLQGWARDDNPIYKNFTVALLSARREFDTRFPAGKWADNGGVTYSLDVSEAYAEFFAFASIIAPPSAARDEDAARARALLMYVIDKASLGFKVGEPFRDPGFGNGDRSGFWGEGFPLTVDWIYASLSAEDKAKIRSVFLRWAASRLTSANAPALIHSAHKNELRWAANNYYFVHIRNLTLMSLAMDPVDDGPVDPSKPREALGNSLESYWGDVERAWLPLLNALLGEGGDGSGGLPPEGFLYGTALGPLHQALFAMQTAGRWNEQQQRLLDSPYWDRFLEGFLHSVAPVPRTLPKDAYLGQVYPVASYGDVLRLWVIPEWIGIFGSLGIHDARGGREVRAQTARWVAENVLEGGAAKLGDRVGQIWGNGRATASILSYMLFEPGAPPAPDPRPRLPLTFLDRPLGRILARTDWGPSASWFAFMCTWKSINHQISDCGQFDFYRKGEWLTKERSGYSNGGVISSTDYHNTLSLENDTLAASSMSWFEPPINRRGSQYLLGLNSGDPTFRASAGAGFVHAEADGTKLYNRTEPHGVAADIRLATRSIVWLLPDHVILYDRASSKTAGRFKRWNLMLPGEPSITGRSAVAKTSSGQQLFLSTLLPRTATLTVAPSEKDNVAQGETMRSRLVVEDPSGPSDLRFLHVLEGADADARPAPAELFRAAGDAPFEGVLVRGTAVLFPVQPIPEGGFKALSYAVPASIKGHLIKGLPVGRYDVAQKASGSRVEIRITPGSTIEADEAGGIVIGSLGR